MGVGGQEGQGELERIVNATHGMNKEKNTIITDDYIDYLLLNMQIGKRPIYSTEVCNDQEGGDICYLTVKPRAGGLEEVETYLSPVGLHCERGCGFCTTTSSIDVEKLACRVGNKMYAMCFKRASQLKGLSGVVVLKERM